ncbi:MAG: hypothetical protein HYV63_01765 [Candidatus Schekmanbacteria bacterium]|nr:hypothetical protein [Candidatus Schekmanbacteria bacterium]
MSVFARTYTLMLSVVAATALLTFTTASASSPRPEVDVTLSSIEDVGGSTALELVLTSSSDRIVQVVLLPRGDRAEESATPILTERVDSMGAVTIHAEIERRDRPVRHFNFRVRLEDERGEMIAEYPLSASFLRDSAAGGYRTASLEEIRQAEDDAPTRQLARGEHFAGTARGFADDSEVE